MYPPPDIGQVLSSASGAHAQIDDALRMWLHLSATCREAFPASDEQPVPDENLSVCSLRLLASPLFCENADYVRMQIIYSLLGEDDPGPLNVITSFLLLDGHSNEATYPRMIDEGCFPRLLELIGVRRRGDAGLHRLLLELMYEMSRVERLRSTDLMQIEDTFVAFLFDLIEGVSDDVDDPYHYPIIKVLVCHNLFYQHIHWTPPGLPALTLLVSAACLE